MTIVRGLRRMAVLFCRSLALPASLPAHFIRLMSPQQIYDGIRIVGGANSNRDNQIFFHDTIEALNMIRKLDSRRYGRLKKVVDIIACSHMGFLAQYRSFKTCVVNYKCVLQNHPHPEERIGNYCCILIHEATHGSIDKRGIAYAQSTYKRIEKLCGVEELRFAKLFNERFGEKSRITIQLDNEQIYFRSLKNIVPFILSHFRRK